MLGLLDPMYYLILAPGLILAAIASWLTKSTFTRYARVGARSGLTGAQAAHQLLRRQGIEGVTIEPVRGFLSDHYDPRSRTLRLSPDVYGSPSLSAIGVACHEAGHAIQHAKAYPPLALRSALVPVTQFGTSGAYILFLLGMFMGPLGVAFMKFGVILFALSVLFTIVTLPVEWDASARAKALMTSTGIVTREEQAHASKVLNAAFLTYVASAVTALLTLLYYLLRLGFLGGDD